MSSHYDPRALLDPKRFSKRPSSAHGVEPRPSSTGHTLAGSPYGYLDGGYSGPSDSTASRHGDGELNMAGMGGLIEKIHGVVSRADHPQKRQKREHSNGETDAADDNGGTFVGGGKGGDLAEYMRRKKEQGKREAASIGDEDEVVLVSDSLQKEVCYGNVEQAKVQAHAVPYPSPTAPVLDPAYWPLIRVELTRRARNTHIISVVDPLGNDFGTVSSSVAIGLAPLMDAQEPSVRVQARILSRRKEANQCPGQAISTYYDLKVNIYGQKRYATSIGRYLSQKQIRLGPPMGVDAGIDTFNPHAKLGTVPRLGASGFGGSSAGYVQRTVEEVRQDVVGMFDSLEQSENLPETDVDARIVTPLLAHQKQALHFMTHKEKERVGDESDVESRSLWRPRYCKNGQKVFYNIITGKEERSKPDEPMGGILADMMGLGKTLSILSLVVSSLAESIAWSAKAPPAPTSADELPLLRNVKTTLLISPLSTVANWEEQIKAHLAPDTLSYYIYHGTSRCGDPDQLAKYDLVITTYSVVSSDFSKRSKKLKHAAASPLQQLNWFRVVLDEAHMIREQSTRQSKAACALSAQRRWAVTGTPVQNRLDDLGALIKFLRIKPFDEKGGFTQFILSPFKNADPEILPKLRLLVDSITLRRLKDRINLPPRHDLIVRLHFNEKEQALYELFAKDSADKMRIVAGHRQESLGGRAYAHVLRAMLRLRLICAHGEELLGEEDLKIMQGASMTNAIALDDEEESGKPALSSKQAYDMFSLMKETNADICNQCNQQIDGDDSSMEESPDTKHDVVGYMTPCYQLLCRDCITAFKDLLQKNAMDTEHASCPLCHTYIRIDFFELRRSQIQMDEEARTHARGRSKPGKKIGRYGGPHAKTRALLQSLCESRMESEAHPDERPIKSVVFSGWTSHLDLIEIALEHERISFVRLDGKMSRVQRSVAMDTFRDDPSVTVILVSIMAGGLGLNLTTASKVFVMEPQFNPAAEAQAIDRVHRLGQTREVTTTRFIMADSFEEKMLELQRKKQNLADLSLSRGKLDKHEAMKSRLEELRSLFK
ncbi:MAG: hypothetical protein M1826_006693 [Phylliscum demangeonii]|nr:MAG: hypothetical protein M1826_006693 [Phylliscum demangeonii]